jgi:NTE family protein
MHSTGIFTIWLAIAMCIPPWTLTAQQGYLPALPDSVAAHGVRVDEMHPTFPRTYVLPEPPRIGIVLSGGGSRGIAQIGVLKALEDAGILPCFVVGTSVGSIVGGLYASGYSPERLEQAMRDVDWVSVLQLKDEADRSTLAVDQKPASDRSILTLRFDGLQPVLPLSVSNGQRLTNLLNELALQGTRHSRDFDHLHFPFRAVATDLISGKRVVLDHGNLSDAMRASSTIPVMYAPVTIDSMALVDGGLLSNIPVDVAQDYGCDLIIAVNTTSALRSRSEITNPLETLDQVFNVMMQDRLDEELANTDILINPALEGHIGVNFDHLDSLVSLGYEAAREMIPAIHDTVAARMLRSIPDLPAHRSSYVVACSHPAYEDDAWFDQKRSMDEILRKAVSMKQHAETAGLRLVYDGDETVRIDMDTYERIASIQLHGTTLLPPAAIAGIESRWRGAAWNPAAKKEIDRYILEDYRALGYSLATIDSIGFDENRIVHVNVREGLIRRIILRGNTRTNHVVLLRELPLTEGEIFRISALKRGMENLAGLNLFHNITFDLEQHADGADITLRVIERPSQLLQAGILVDNERNAQLGILLRDANFLGTGTELAGTFFSGDKNRRYGLRYSTNRLFYTPFSLQLQGYYGFRDFNNYYDVEDLPSNRFERDVASTYRSISYGAAASFGLYVERIGNLLATLRSEKQQLRTDQIQRMDAEIIDENNLVVSISLSSTIDTQDRYPYPRKGLFFTAEYLSAQTALGSDVAFSRISSTYEFYVPVLGSELVVHPRIFFGYGDKTMPRSEEFRLGGLSSFLGMRENEFNGRQLVTGSMELRYLLPVSILFDSYLSVRYDLGRTWANPELIKIEELRHGIGFILGLDTPIGPADFAIGRSFYLVRNNPDTFARWGPTNLYFSIGVELF